MMSIARTLAVAVGVVALAQGASAVTMKPLQNSQAKVYHCINSQNQELKGARNARECKAPYHWMKIAQNNKNAKPGSLAQMKPKKRVAKGDAKGSAQDSDGTAPRTTD